MSSLAYDGGYLIAPASGGGKREWEYFKDTYKVVRPGGIYLYALVVEAEYDGDFELSSLPTKPSDYNWTGDFNIIPAYGEIPFGYFAADKEFMQEWSQKVQYWFGSRRALFFGGSYDYGTVEYFSANWLDSFQEGVNGDIIIAKAVKYVEEVTEPEVPLELL